MVQVPPDLAWQSLHAQLHQFHDPDQLEVHTTAANHSVGVRRTPPNPLGFGKRSARRLSAERDYSLFTERHVRPVGPTGRSELEEELSCEATHTRWGSSGTARLLADIVKLRTIRRVAQGREVITCPDVFVIILLPGCGWQVAAMMVGKNAGSFRGTRADSDGRGRTRRGRKCWQRRTLRDDGGLRRNSADTHQAR
jgi:hypothetical protein